ncbi:hypothetical protein VNO77_46334 [Canavalia gladiata]|uniref:Uncharacterized protein n=1 Tax=Canavalia gladiata TaxID=3824 RepID=A0AAN9JIU7_CANGL
MRKSPLRPRPKGNVNYLNKKTGVYLRIRSFLISDYVKYPRAYVGRESRQSEPEQGSFSRRIDASPLASDKEDSVSSHKKVSRGSHKLKTWASLLKAILTPSRATDSLENEEGFEGLSPLRIWLADRP